MTNDVRILVVEDEALIADLVVSGLEEAGYVVTIVGTAEDAIVLLDDDQAAFRAVITDINLAPDKSTGWDVARRAREGIADLPIIYMSGASTHEWTSRGVPNSVLIGKPFAIGQIITAVSTLLNSGASNDPG